MCSTTTDVRDVLTYNFLVAKHYINMSERVPTSKQFSLLFFFKIPTSELASVGLKLANVKSR
jgi:hypothetical protein